MNARRFRTTAQTVRTLVFDRFLPLIAWVIDLLIWNHATELRNGHHVSPWLIVGLSAALYPTLALRRRHPLPVFAIQLLWATTASVCLTDFGPIAGVVVALYAVAARSGTPWSTLAFAGVTVPLTIQTFWRAGPLSDHLISLLIEALVAAAPWALGAHDRTAELQEAAAVEARRGAFHPRGSAAMTARVLLADDQPLVLGGLTMLLSAQPGLVLSFAATGVAGTFAP